MKIGVFSELISSNLKDNLLGIWEPDLIFMQDNAPIHKAKKVMK